MVVGNNIEEVLLNSEDLEFVIAQDITTENFKVFLDKLEALEDEIKQKDPELFLKISLDMKKTAFACRQEFFRKILSSDKLVDPVSMTNIFVLIKPNMALDENFFSDSHLMVNDIEELLDVKHEHKEAISRFIRQLSIWYFSIFKSVHKVEVNFLEDIVEIPMKFSIALMSLSFIDMSEVVAKSPAFSTDELHFVSNAYSFLCDLVDKQKITNIILQGILNGNS